MPSKLCKLICFIACSPKHFSISFLFEVAVVIAAQFVDEDIAGIMVPR
jgi:hypothetical protein